MAPALRRGCHVCALCVALPPSPAVIHSASSRSLQLAPSLLSSDSPCASCPKLSKPFAGDPAGALALVGSLSTGAATREASLELDLGAVEKKLTEFTEMHNMVQNELEATDELYKLAEDNDKKGLASAPQNFTEEQSKEVGEIEDEEVREIKNIQNIPGGASALGLTG